jgi:nucleoside-triphosphatase
LSLQSPPPPSTPFRAWLLTGPPGIGKSTVVARVVYLLRSKGLGIGGCLTKERKEGRERVGFIVIDLMSGREAVLASSKKALGPRVGRYRVNIPGLVDVGAHALREAAATADVIVIDEVGPMELTSPEFKRGVESCLASGKPILAVVHEQMKDPLIEEFRALPGKTLLEVTLHNREGLAASLAEQILAAIPAESGGHAAVP